MYIMKRLKLLFAALMSLSITSCDAKSYEPKKLDPNQTYDNVYLIMGQSNASGVSPYSFLESKEPELYQKYTEGNSKVLISFDTDQRINNDFVPTKFGYGCNEEFFGPEIGIAEVLSQKEETSYIIKATWGGTCLQTQYVDADGKKYDLYYRFVRFIIKQLRALEENGKNPRVRGVFWMQGESDTFLDYKAKYQEAEQQFYEYLRHDLNDWIYEYFNFVDAYIFTRGICWVEPEIVNDCKQRFSEVNEHCYCIKTNGEDDTAIMTYLKCETEEGDDLAHYDSKSMVLLGKTAGSYLIK